ncbi:type II secretion system protein N [Petrachloros mirabilis]
MFAPRRVVILLIVIGTTFLIAHTINAVIAEALFVPTGMSWPRTATDSAAIPDHSPEALSEHIRTSGLFPLPPDPIGMANEVVTGSGTVRQTLNAASKIKLLGVVVGSRTGVSAIIEELATKRQFFYRLHEQIPDIGEISEIRHDGILIRQGNQQELLVLSTGQNDKPPAAQIASAGPAGPGAGATGSIRKVLDRREVELAMNNLPKLLSQARAVPVLANGAMTGFRLDYIAPTSFYEKIGLQYGDILKQVNGVEIKDPGTMLSLFQQLRNERSVKLDVLRNNQPTTMTFDIR